MKTNTWKQLFNVASSRRDRLAIHGVRVDGDGFGTATDGMQLLRLPMTDDDRAQICGERNVTVPYCVAQALAVGATAALAGDGWHVDGSEWAIDPVAQSYPDVARVIPVDGDVHTLKLPLAWLRELDSRQWTRADRALLAHLGCTRPPRLGVVRGHPNDNYGTDAPLLLVRSSELGENCDICAQVREPVDGKRYRQRRIRNYDWAPGFAMVLSPLLAYASKGGELTICTNGSQFGAVSIDLPGGGVYVRMPLRSGASHSTAWQTFERQERGRWGLCDAG